MRSLGGYVKSVVDCRAGSIRRRRQRRRRRRQISRRLSSARRRSRAGMSDTPTTSALSVRHALAAVRRISIQPAVNASTAADNGDGERVGRTAGRRLMQTPCAPECNNAPPRRRRRRLIRHDACSLAGRHCPHRRRCRRDLSAGQVRRRPTPPTTPPPANERRPITPAQYAC